MADNSADIPGPERAAILLMSLGEEDAAAIIRHMDAAEVQRVGQAMAALREIPRERTQSVMSAFVDTVENGGAGGAGAHDFVRRVLTSSLGKQRADMFLERILEGVEPGAGIDQLKWMHPRQVAQLVREEHPQVIATVLAHLDAEHGAAAVALLPDGLRADVMFRVATLDEVPQTALSELDAVVEQRASEGTATPLRRLGGTQMAAGILNSLETDQKSRVMTHIEEMDPELSQQIKDAMFVFDNLLAVDDRAIQSILREIQSDTLAVALRGADPEVQEKIFRNMSKRAGEILRDEMEVRGPVKLSEVEFAQKEIVAVAQRLADEGTISLTGTGGGDYV